MRLATRAAAAAGIAAGLAVTVVGVSAPAWAAPAPVTCGTTAPPPGLSLPLLSPTIKVSSPNTELPTVTVTPASPGTTVVVTCDADPSSPVATFPLTGSGPAGSASAVVPSSMPLLRNGYYTFTVPGLLGTTTASKNVLLNAPPDSPTGVQAVPAADGRSAVLSWTPNPEPDVTGYEVDRTGGGGPPTKANVTIPTYRDSTRPGAAYTYMVYALRPGLRSVATILAGITTPGTSSPGGNRGGVQGSHGGGGGGGGGGVTGSYGGSGGGGNLRIGGGGVTGSFSKPSLGSSKSVTGAPTLGGFQGTLPYGHGSVGPGGQLKASRITSPAKEDGPHGYPVWAIALAVLLLAGAACLFTLRRRIAKEPALEPVPPNGAPPTAGGKRVPARSP